MNKVLYVHIGEMSGNSGVNKRSQQNLDGCIMNVDCEEYSVDEWRGFFSKIANSFVGFYIIGLMESTKLVKKIRNAGTSAYDAVFIDASIHGSTIKLIKRLIPSIKVIVHYHNYQALYFHEECLYRKMSLLKRLFLESLVCKNERLSTQYSDFQVFISNEDLKCVCKAYGKDDEHAFVAPPMLKDNYRNVYDETSVPYAVFLGSSFYANDQAAQFLIKEVAPYLNIRVVIVGNGMKHTFTEEYENCEVLDYVEDLNSLLNNACCFVAPVFFGSGAKIKIAEAFMHGKYVVGTKMAFAGYEIGDADVSLCNNAEDFIKEINGLDKDKKFYSRNRDLYKRLYDISNNKKAYSFLKEI